MSVPTSAELSVGGADSCVGGILGVEVVGGAVTKMEAFVGGGVIGSVVGLVEGTTVIVPAVLSSVDSFAGNSKVCTRSPQSSPPSGDSKIFAPRR